MPVKNQSTDGGMSVSTNVTATVPTRYRNAILRLTRERVLRGKRDGNGMWRFSAFDLLNFLYDEDELSGAARVVWGICCLTPSNTPFATFS